MTRLAALTLAVALVTSGSIGALAATSGSGADAGMPESWQRQFDPMIDHTGDRYTDALNLLGADGYTGISNFSASGQDFTASAVDPHNNRVQVMVDPSAGTVKASG
jgi:hypothetical protein